MEKKPEYSDAFLADLPDDTITRAQKYFTYICYLEWIIPYMTAHRDKLARSTALEMSYEEASGIAEKVRYISDVIGFFTHKVEQHEKILKEIGNEYRS